jgi:hypothetical protein
MPYPPTASSIASFVDFTSDSNDPSLVLALNEGLHLYASRYTTENADPIVLTKAPCFIGAKDLLIAQDNLQLSVWAHNYRDELGYLSGTIENLSQARTATLLPDGRATAFTALKSRAEGPSPATHTLLATDQAGNLTLLQQALDTGIWRDEPFFVEQGGNLKEVQSYTLNVVVTSVGSKATANGMIRLKSSFTQTVTIDGRLTTLDTRGTWCRLSAESGIILIIQTMRITCQPLEVLEVKIMAGDLLKVASDTLIDPSKEVIKGLSSLTTLDDLNNAKIKNNQQPL